MGENNNIFKAFGKSILRTIGLPLGAFFAVIIILTLLGVTVLDITGSSTTSQAATNSALDIYNGKEDITTDITKCDSSIVITDVSTLKKAFKGYSASGKLVDNAQAYLNHQETYKVNAIFAAAVSITETGAGRAGHAVDGKNNWYNIKNPSTGEYQTYSSSSDGIKAFFELISSKYFTHTPTPQNTVRTIGTDPDSGENGHSYCEHADAEGGWSDNTIAYMKQMYSAAGITFTSENSTSNTSGENQNTNGDLLKACEEVTQTLLNRECRYPSSNGSIDYSKLNYTRDIKSCYEKDKYICCATFTSLALYKSGLLTEKQINAYGYHSTAEIGPMLTTAGWKEVSMSNKQAGDVLCKSNNGRSGAGHVMICAGNGKVWDQSSAVYSSSGTAPKKGPYSRSDYSGFKCYRAP